MEIRKGNYVNYIGILISILAGIISVYAQSKDPQTGLFLFLALVGVIILYFILSLPVEYFIKKMKIIDLDSNKIEELRKDLNIVKDKLNFRKDVAELDIRISVLEQLFKMKNKKGQIDPRWVIIIVILILLFLYLRAKGLI